MSNKSVSIIVSNDIQNDRRVIRIAKDLSSEGYKVKIIGRSLGRIWAHDDFSVTLLSLWFNTGPMFYLELNLRLWLYLFKQPADIIYSVDFDTLLAAKMILFGTKSKFIFDSHEWFTEVPELSRSPIKKILWRSLGKWVVPRADLCVTVSEPIARALQNEYKKPFFTILNTPLFQPFERAKGVEADRLTLVYLGVLNEGRGLAEMIKCVMRYDQITFHIIGDGILLEELSELANGVERIIFHGMLSEALFMPILRQADIGINLLDESSQSYHLSLANKFFDYMHQGLAIMTMDFPCYRNINDDVNGAILISDLTPASIEHGLKQFIQSTAELVLMKERNLLASKKYCWQVESKKLVSLIKDKTD